MLFWKADHGITGLHCTQVSENFGLFCSDLEGNKSPDTSQTAPAVAENAHLYPLPPGEEPIPSAVTPTAGCLPPTLLAQQSCRPRPAPGTAVGPLPSLSPSKPNLLKTSGACPVAAAVLTHGRAGRAAAVRRAWAKLRMSSSAVTDPAAHCQHPRNITVCWAKGNSHTVTLQT